MEILQNVEIQMDRRKRQEAQEWEVPKISRLQLHFPFRYAQIWLWKIKESFEGDGGEIPGVVLKERTRKEGAVRMTEVKILNAQGARAMGKPELTYQTLQADEWRRRMRIVTAEWWMNWPCS